MVASCLFLRRHCRATTLLLVTLLLGACADNSNDLSTAIPAPTTPAAQGATAVPENTPGVTATASQMPTDALAATSVAGTPVANTIPDGQVVAPVIETAPMPHDGDAADDPAIWVNPSDPAMSTIIGTDKLGGLAVYDLTGAQLQYLPDGDMNNVDLRGGFSLGGQAVTLVTAGNRTDDSIAIYRLDPATRGLENVAARTITTLETYGSCMYHSLKTGAFYYFVNSKDGDVEQWELFDSGGKVDARKVRAFAVGSQTEGCVADDELGRFYIGEESTAIWRYGAEPEDGNARAQVDHTGAGGHLSSNIEGLTLVYGLNGGGYLIVSSQGSDAYAIYRRTDNAYVAGFTIGAGEGIDAVSDTDGIDATAASLGPALPHGVFVAQDGSNSGDNQNFKLVPLERILGDLG
jgi:3-phytase